jgi:hypothetical protein
VIPVTESFPICEHICFSSFGKGLRYKLKGERSMTKYIKPIQPGLAFFAVAFLSLAPAVASAQATKDSEEFTGFLAQAKTEAVQLQKSTEEMNSFVHSSTSFATEAAKIDEIKQHVNKLGELFTKMDNVAAASTWQQMAVGDIRPMLEELSANVTMTIFNLSAAPDRLVFTSFPEYVEANAETAADLEQTISDYVAYGEAKRKAEELSLQLELPD